MSTVIIDRREKWLTYSQVPNLRYYMITCSLMPIKKTDGIL